jgi:hypothetical protein
MNFKHIAILTALAGMLATAAPANAWTPNPDGGEPLPPPGFGQFRPPPRPQPDPLPWTLPGKLGNPSPQPSRSGNPTPLSNRLLLPRQNLIEALRPDLTRPFKRVR